MSVSYNFAVVRVVPRVHIGTFANVGVLVHARTADFLGVRIVTAPDELAERVRVADVELLSRYLRAWEGICQGATAFGRVALLPPSERFHWLTAPRSDILQCSPVHGGICDDPARILDELFGEYVRAEGARR